MHSVESGGQLCYPELSGSIGQQSEALQGLCGGDGGEGRGSCRVESRVPRVQLPALEHSAGIHFIIIII